MPMKGLLRMPPEGPIRRSPRSRQPTHTWQRQLYMYAWHRRNSMSTNQSTCCRSAHTFRHRVMLGAALTGFLCTNLTVPACTPDRQCDRVDHYRHMCRVCITHQQPGSQCRSCSHQHVSTDLNKTVICGHLLDCQMRASPLRYKLAMCKGVSPAKPSLACALGSAPCSNSNCTRARHPGPFSLM
jgi:hypothetical protein